MKIFLIFCNTLFDLNYLKKQYNISLKDDFDKIIIIEHSSHFTKYNFGKTKLVYHKATMFEYKDYLLQNNINFEYIEIFKFNNKNFYKKTYQYFCIDPLDKALISELENNDVNIFENKNFLLTYAEHLRLAKNSNNIRFTTFYDNIKDKYNFKYKSMDKENRKAFPKKLISNIPDRITNMVEHNNKNINVINAKKYINNNFKNNPPYYEYNIPIILPINHKDSIKYFNEFLDLYALNNFSDYQDAVISPELSLSGAVLLYHSGISASLNNGLITIDIILNELFKKFNYNKTKNIEYIRLIENIFRQLSFREYQLYCFINEDIYKQIINNNYLNCQNGLNKNLYNGTTKIKILDDFIKLAFHFGYIHHIIRLMLFSIYFLFNDIHPMACMQWMIEFSCDSYEFIMIGNVFLMCYSNNINLNHKPSFGFNKSYIHASNYLKKMSIGYKNDDYGNWDLLFYSFVKKKYNKLKIFNARMPFLKQIINK
jgi:deoxyribodipyrimidine photolyase-related protein